MAKRGRKPKPTALKLLEGNPGKRPLNPAEPRPDVAMPDAPAHLDALALAEWQRLATELNRLGLLTAVDRAAFAGYCSAYSRWVQASLDLAREGAFTIQTEKGNIIQHPLVGIVNKAQEVMLKFLVEFGLTPSSRSRVSVSNKQEDAFEKEFGVNRRAAE